MTALSRARVAFDKATRISSVFWVESETSNFLILVRSADFKEVFRSDLCSAIRTRFTADLIFGISFTSVAHKPESGTDE